MAAPREDNLGRRGRPRGGGLTDAPSLPMIMYMGISPTRGKRLLAPLSLLLAATGIGAASLPGGGNGGGGQSAKPSGDSGGGGPVAPVARTFTKLVKVVPGPIKALIGILAALAAACGLRSWLHGRRARHLERQRKELLDDVGLLQRALLPDVPARIGALETSVGYRPAEGPAAGGDFYDVFEIEGGRIAIIVGDVCGHGRQ